MNTNIKAFFLLSFFILVLSEANSQDNRNLRAGFKITPGMNWVNANNTYAKSNGSSIGFGFAFMLDKKIQDNYYFATELNVSTMTNNVKLKDTVQHTINDGTNRTYNNISFKYRVQYIEIPLTFKFRTNENNGMRYWGQFGVAPSFIIRNSVSTTAKQLITNNNFPSDEKYNPNDSENDALDFKDYEDNFSILRASMIIGAGVEYRLSGNTSFYGGLRFNNGLTDILRDKKSKMINNVLALEIGMYF